MQQQPRDIFPGLPDRISGLADLAENLWWSWHPEARMLFKRLDRRAWKESNHNPDRMLKELPGHYLKRASSDPDYLRHYDLVMWQFKKDTQPVDCPELNTVSKNNTRSIAYFSAEYGLHHCLPFYAGGLGFLAGDHLKESSDLGIPLIAVGFMYPQGYLRQQIKDDGWQADVEQTLDRDAAPISRIYSDDGNQMVVRIPWIDPPIYVAVWLVQVGRIPLYLLDTDIEANFDINRGICARLYSGNREIRLRQEIVLGMGGLKVLDELGISNIVLHLNEGHAAFALLARLQSLIKAGLSYEDACRRIQETSIFTTHTPVPAGHDVFSLELIEKYFQSYWTALDLNSSQIMQLGRNPDDPGAGFNMTALALRLCGYRNGVSKRHGEVSRQMWQSLWPEHSIEMVPIDYVTNGVHVPTWIEPKIRLLLNEYFPQDWISSHDIGYIWEFVDEIPDEELWKTHFWLKIKLIDTLRNRVRQRRIQDKEGANLVLAGGALLDPSVLTIGFARRFAAYKRADLILYDMQRLKKLINNRWMPIQIIFAGKAHPDDTPGKEILQRVFQAALNPEIGCRIAFLENYGEQYAQYMLHGVDVWLNNPLPPMEASGTSGMKAALNGVPSLSILDGWWMEGYNGRNGWIFGQEKADPEHQPREQRNETDALSLYNTLEQEVIPLYYDVDENGVPVRWVRWMKESIKSNAHQFSTRRMLKEYLKKYYAPAMKKV